MICRLAPILGIVVTSLAACSADSRTSSQVARSGSAAEQTPAVLPPSADRTPAADVVDTGGKNSLSGTWKFVMGTMTWTVRLAPRRGLPGEYLGLGERETRDEQGKAVTMELAAVVEKGNLRAWLGLGVIKCTAPFRLGKPTTGKCTQIAGDPAGPFRAERLTAAAP